MSPKQTSLLFQVPTYGVSRSELRDFAGQLAREVAGGRPFDCLITTDRELRRLNLEFRNQNRATDVLSFPAAGGNSFLGDIAISYDRAKRQAGDYGLSVQQEIQILMLHGVLHLLGMDHESDRGRMARAEAKWRATLGLPTALIERARV
ncbi:MAG TPA: rRNA maturation RNase YbeY [Bryobacteraceae bacterium]|nr:rRNA maturation RNase YbeY [Bryobacteraceae bacterium]